MASISEEAKSYEGGKLANIADLQKVSTAIELNTRTAKDSNGDEFTYDYINMDGVNYRVPISVIANLKILMEERPNLKFFKVRKDGVGMTTKYTVIPVE